VSIFLSVFDVHINRAPVAGKVVDVQYQPGQFLPAFRADASDLNEQNVVTFQTEERTVTVKQIAGILARRIVCRVNAGDHLSLGERFGLIRFGSRVDILIPSEYEVYACQGQRVRGGESILAASSTRSSHHARTVETESDQTPA
jgi:phosphatidylserine decarboxylase